MGRDLTLQSEQDSDRYDAKQQNLSGGLSVPVEAGSGSGYLTASRDKLHSNFDSVNEQTGLFAGDDGYQITVGKHTQLDGAVIASTADKAKNSLDTGTLGWSDIDNRADFSAEHSGGSLSTGGPVGKDLLTNMAGGMLSGANNSGHAAGTTQAAVSDGQLTIRDGEHQQQDIAELNRDVEHANDGSIGPIFNKEKEQKRLKEAQLIGELGMQAMDIARTQGEIAALEAQKDSAKLAAARAELESKHKPGDANITDAAVAQQAYNNAQAEWGTGSNVQKAMQAVTGALTALAGNNLAGALASGASPYLATEIKKLTTGPDGQVNTAANAMAHAVLGAVTAELNNQSALAGGVGAGGGELTARFIMEKLFPGKQPSELTESEKQQVSGLSQLAAGIAGGVASGDISGAVTGGQAGKNAVENNFLLSLLAPPPPMAGQTTPQTEANAAIAQKLDSAVKEFGEQQVKQCLSGGACPGVVATALLAISAMTDHSDDKAASAPNVGQNLTDKEKAELGGSGSGTPGGWGPEDEENARNNEAHSAANAKNLNAELTGKEIANGHAFEKHVIQQNEFADLGIKTKEQFARHIENVVNNPTSKKGLSGGRSAYWDQSTGTVVIRNPKPGDGGTAFRPVNGRAYFDNLR